MNGFDLGSGKLHSFLHGIIRPGDKALMDKGLIISKFYAVNKKKLFRKGWFCECLFEKNIFACDVFNFMVGIQGMYNIYTSLTLFRQI